MEPNEIVMALRGLKKTITDIEKAVRADMSRSDDRPQGRAFYGIDATTTGFHILKNKWRQRSFIGEHCGKLLESGVLKKTIDATVDSVLNRTAAQGFLIDDEVAHAYRGYPEGNRAMDGGKAVPEVPLLVPRETES